MVKIIGIFKQDTSPIAFIDIKGDTMTVQAVNEADAAKLKSQLDEVMDLSDGGLSLRTEVVDQEGNISIGSKQVRSTDPEYIDALAETVHSVSGFLTSEIFSEAKQILINLSKGGLSKEKKDKMFADLINMSEEYLVELAKSQKYIVEMG